MENKLTEESKNECFDLIEKAKERGPIGKEMFISIFSSSTTPIYFKDDELAKLQPFLDIQDFDILYELCVLDKSNFRDVNSASRNNLEFMSSLIAGQNGVIDYLNLSQATNLKNLIDDQLEDYISFIAQTQHSSKPQEMAEFFAKADAKKILTLLDIQIKTCKKQKEWKNKNLEVNAITPQQGENSPRPRSPKSRFQYAKIKHNEKD